MNESTISTNRTNGDRPSFFLLGNLANGNAGYNVKNVPLSGTARIGLETAIWTVANFLQPMDISSPSRNQKNEFLFNKHAHNKKPAKRKRNRKRKTPPLGPTPPVRFQHIKSWEKVNLRLPTSPFRHISSHHH
jgi:hypothetical protein